MTGTNLAVFGSAQGVRLIAAGILLTLVAIVGREVVPKRTLDLTVAANRGAHFLAAPSNEKIGWVDEPHLHLRCHYDEADAQQPCGLTIILGQADDASRGIDLRPYRSIALDLSYRGNASFVRLSIRNFDARFSLKEDGNSARIQSINLRAHDIDRPIAIELSELAVPEWWIAQFNLPREFNLPSFENVTALSIDLPGRLGGPPHELALRGLRLQGEWISREALYLGILSAWMLCAIGVIGWHLAEARRQHRRQAREIEYLVARAARLHAEQDDLRRQACIDGLTGVLNRRGIEQAIAELGARGPQVAVILADVDHFKRVNDSHGHSGGDQVLQRVAAVMAQSLRSSDLFGRWGGEEFIVACVDCDAEHAAVVAEKIRQRVEASAFGARQRIAVTASFGVAAAHGPGAFAEALHRADAALYRAKSLGRNRVAVDDDGNGLASA